MIREPRCFGECRIDLEFTGGVEHYVCLAASALTGVVLLGMLLLPAAAQLIGSLIKLGKQMATNWVHPASGWSATGCKRVTWREPDWWLG